MREGEPKISTFILRNIDPEFWGRVQAKAKAENVQLYGLILRLVAEWAGEAPPELHKRNPTTTPAKKP
jgi:hypothetical protein